MTATLLIGVCILGIAGVALLVHGVRGRRIDDHPVCRACAFDLVGVYPGAIVCPECGANTDAAGAIRVGRRRKRRWAIASGTLVVIVLLGGGGAIGWAAARNYDWNRAKPLWWLMLEAEHGGLATVGSSLTEVIRRSDSGSLGSAARQRLAERALAAQADASRPWSARWGDLFEAAWIDGLVEPDQIARYAKQSILPKLVARERVTRGDSIAISLVVECRMGTRKPMVVRVTNHGVRLGDKPVFATQMLDQYTFGHSLRVRRADRPWRPGGDGAIMGVVVAADQVLPRGAMIPQPADRAGLASGELRTRLEFGVRTVDPGTSPGGLGAYNAMEKPGTEWDDAGWVEGAVAETGEVACWRQEFTSAITVLPEAQASVALVTDATLAEQIRAALQVEPLRYDAEWGMTKGAVRLVRQIPIDCAFDVIWRIGDREFAIGSVVYRRSALADVELGAFTRGDFVETGIKLPADTQAVDLILRPSVKRAAGTPDITRIWDGEIVFERVRIEPGS